MGELLQTIYCVMRDASKISPVFNWLLVRYSPVFTLVKLYPSNSAEPHFRKLERVLTYIGHVQ